MLSFSLGFGTALDLASQMVGGMLPVYLVPIGVALGVTILAAIIKAMSSIKRIHYT